MFETSEIYDVLGGFHTPRLTRDDGHEMIDEFEQQIAKSTSESGGDSVKLIDPLIKLACIRFVRREHILARESFLEAMNIAVRCRSEDHKDILRLTSLIGLLQYHSRQADATEWLLRALATADHRHGMRHIDSLTCAHLLWLAQYPLDRRNTEDRIREAARSFQRSDPDTEQVRSLYAHVVNQLAMFAKNEMADFQAAEFHYLLSLELEDDNTICSNYALLLGSCLNRPDEAKRYFDRSRVEFTGDAVGCGNYATFTAQVLGDSVRAEQLFQTALRSNPTCDTVLANYSSFLISEHRLEEAALAAERAWRQTNPFSSRQLSRAVYCAALAATMQKKDASMYLGQLKWILNEGVQVAPWMCARTRQAIRQTLKPSEIRLFLSLADVFDSLKAMPALEALPLWQAVKPVNPQTPWLNSGTNS